MVTGVVKLTKKSPGKLDSKLKVRIAQLKLSQIQIAEMMGESKQTISGWSTGRIEPSLKKAVRLSKMLDCTVNDLWEYHDDKEE